MPPLENPENFLQAEELFNMANVQKATEKPAYDDINVSEEENTDPQNVDISEDDDSQNNSLPIPPLNKKLKRISRAVTKTESQVCSSDTEAEDTMNTNDNIEEQVEGLKMNRKSVGYKKALAIALANIHHRAPTPARGLDLQENIANDDDIRKASSAK